MTQLQINALEARQCELERIMQKSDAHASKCQKLGLSFAEQYPEDLEEYQAANDEFNRNEEQLTGLYAQRDAEEAAVAAADHIDA